VRRGGGTGGGITRPSRAPISRVEKDSIHPVSKKKKTQVEKKRRKTTQG